MRKGTKKRSGKLTIWVGSGGTGDGNDQSVDGESPDSEEGENGFVEHDEEEQTTTAPGLKCVGRKGRIRVGCTAAEKTKESASTSL